MSEATPTGALEFQALKERARGEGIQRPGGATRLGGQTSPERRWKTRVLAPVGSPTETPCCCSSQARGGWEGDRHPRPRPNSLSPPEAPVASPTPLSTPVLGWTGPRPPPCCPSPPLGLHLCMQTRPQPPASLHALRPGPPGRSYPSPRNKARLAAPTGCPQRPPQGPARSRCSRNMCRCRRDSLVCKTAPASFLLTLLLLCPQLATFQTSSIKYNPSNCKHLRPARC